MRVRVPLLPAAVRWTAVAAVAAVLFYLSVVTVPPESSPVVELMDATRLLEFARDKWRHFVGYVGLAGTLAYALADPPWSTGRTALVVVGVVAAYGIGIELLQAPLPARYVSVGDALANALGAVLVTPWFFLVRYLEFVPAVAWIRGLAGEAGS